jgi:hypothetical protein
MRDALLIGAFFAVCVVINWLAVRFDEWRWLKKWERRGWE